MVSRPPSISRVTLALPEAISILEANAAWGQSSRAASIWPVALLSPSMACLPISTTSGACSCTIFCSTLAAFSGSRSWSVTIRMALSAPMARAVRRVSWHCCTPMETAITSVATPFSFSRTASSTAISSKGFIDIFTLARSTPD